MLTAEGVMKASSLIFVALAVVEGGCPTAIPLTPGHPELAHYFTLRTHGTTQQARLEGTRLHGPDVDVVKLEDGYRGQAYIRLIDLRVEDDRIIGMVGPGRTELYVSEIPDGLRVEGLYAGSLGRLELRSDEIAGSLGRCTFDLLRTSTRGFWYEGRAVCGGSVMSAQLALPDELPKRPLLERALLTAVFLGRA